MSEKTYFGFAIADSMFSQECEIVRKVVPVEIVKVWAANGELTPCLNPSHVATINAMRERFGIEISIPETPPKVELQSGDNLIVMGVRGLPRLTDRHEYTSEEIAQASFTFAMYSVR